MREDAVFKIRISKLAGVVVVGGTLVVSAAPATAAPTCSDTLGIATHGQHIVGDYVMGTGHDGPWPPAGQVGAVVGGRGAAVPGGAGPGFHFTVGVSPGASFCLSQAQAPGGPPGRG